ncbi:MAG: MFS transporter [Gemmatales bacterium]
MSACFSCAGLGQSALSTTSLTLIGKWFPHRVIVAMAVFGIVSTIGFIALFSLVGYTAKSVGWRQTWVYIGFGAFVLAIFFHFFCRNPPGISLPDGKHSKETRAEWSTLWEALRSPIFWLFALSSALFNWVSSGIGLFNEDVLAERGFNYDHYIAALGVVTMVTLVCNALGGWLSTRWPLPRLMALGMFMLAACLLTLPFMTEIWHVYINAVFLGVSAGVVIVVFFAFCGAYFGPKHLGKIQGVAQSLTVLSSALGPVSLALSKEYLGTYRPLFLVLSTLACLSSAAFPHRKA